MGKTLIIAEPRLDLSRNIIIDRANKLRNRIEVRCGLDRCIGRMRKEKTPSSVISPEAPVAVSQEKTWGLPVISSELTAAEEALCHEHSNRLARQWHGYGQLPGLLQVEQVDMGTVIEAWIYYRIKPFFRQVALARRVMAAGGFDSICVESDTFPSGKVFAALAAQQKITCRVLQPAWYGRAKSQAIDRMRSRINEEILEPPALYAMTGKETRDIRYKVLIDAPYYINYFRALAPVLDELLLRPAVRCHVIGKQSYARLALPNAEQVAFKPGNQRENALKLARLKKYYYEELKKDRDFQELFSFDGVKLWTVVEKEVAGIFNRLGMVMKNITSFRRILDLVQPDILVVAFDETTAVRGHVLLAQKSQIPTLEVQHGEFMSALGFYSAPLSDVFAAGGSYSRSVYEKAGVAGDKIRVTGWPKYDAFHSMRQQRNAGPGKRVLFATWPVNTKTNLEIIARIGQWIGDNTDIELLVKPHPSEKEDVYRAFARQYERVRVYPSRTDIAGLISAADIMVCFNSTAGLEAALLDKPIICMNLNDGTPSVYVSDGVAIEVKQLAGLIPAIKDALFDDGTRNRLTMARQKFSYEHAYIADGKASQRVADLIIGMIEEKRQAAGR